MLIEEGGRIVDKKRVKDFFYIVGFGVMNGSIQRYPVIAMSGNGLAKRRKDKQF